MKLLLATHDMKIKKRKDPSPRERQMRETIGEGLLALLDGAMGKVDLVIEKKGGQIFKLRLSVMNTVKRGKELDLKLVTLPPIL